MGGRGCLIDLLVGLVWEYLWLSCYYGIGAIAWCVVVGGVGVGILGWS